VTRQDSCRRNCLAGSRCFEQIYPQNDREKLLEAYLAGYTQVRGLSINIDAYLQTFKVMRDMGVVNFILSSKNARVQEWGVARLAMLMEQMKAYLEGKPSVI
jgi:hypothetical protein